MRSAKPSLALRPELQFFLKDRDAVRCHWTLGHQFVVHSLLISGRNREKVPLSSPAAHWVAGTAGMSVALHISGFQLYL